MGLYFTIHAWDVHDRNDTIDARRCKSIQCKVLRVSSNQSPFLSNASSYVQIP